MQPESEQSLIYRRTNNVSLRQTVATVKDPATKLKKLHKLQHQSEVWFHWNIWLMFYVNVQCKVVDVCKMTLTCSNRILQRVILKWQVSPSLHLILVTPVYICPSVSRFGSLVSKWMENTFWKMTQHFRDPASSDHPITDWDEGVEAEDLSPGLLLWPPYTHHTFLQIK